MPTCTVPTRQIITERTQTFAPWNHRTQSRKRHNILCTGIVHEDTEHFHRLQLPADAATQATLAHSTRHSAMLTWPSCKGSGLAAWTHMCMVLAPLRWITVCSTSALPISRPSGQVWVYCHCAHMHCCHASLLYAQGMACQTTSPNCPRLQHVKTPLGWTSMVGWVLALRHGWILQNGHMATWVRSPTPA